LRGQSPISLKTRKTGRERSLRVTKGNQLSRGKGRKKKKGRGTERKGGGLNQVVPKGSEKM